MTITAQVTKTTQTAFHVRIHKGNTTLGTRVVAKPVDGCADGWMARGQAKNATEAARVALKWAGQ